MESRKYVGRIASLIVLSLVLLSATSQAAAQRHHYVTHHTVAPAAGAPHRAPGGTTRAVQRYGSERSHGLIRVPYSHAVYYTGGGGDYLSRMEGTSRWPSGQPIRVYVVPGRSTFPGIVSSCFSQWSHASGGKIAYTMVSSPQQADYIVRWTTRQHEAKDGTEAGLTTTDTNVDDRGSEYIQHARTNILTRFDGRSLSDKEIAETCLHEIGHGLGLEGHSPNPADIMYYAVSSRQSGCLTKRDANTIAHLYAY